MQTCSRKRDLSLFKNRIFLEPLLLFKKRMFSESFLEEEIESVSGVRSLCLPKDKRYEERGTI